MTEADIHREVVRHLKRRGVPGAVWWHTMNEGKRAGRRAGQLKNFGIRKGVSDIIALHRGRMFALELKTEKGNPTEEQMQFVSDFNSAGGFACIVTGTDTALRILETWGLLRGES